MWSISEVVLAFTSFGMVGLSSRSGAGGERTLGDGATAQELNHGRVLEEDSGGAHLCCCDVWWFVVLACEMRGKLVSKQAVRPAKFGSGARGS